MTYDEALTLREAREVYFQRSGFNSDTYTDAWVRLPLGKVTITLPNFSARKRAVQVHDLNHILGEYKTDWRGEFEIAGFEIGAGCGSYWAAWMINLQGFLAGALIYPRDCLCAFARGRRSKSIYTANDINPLLNEKVGSLRDRFEIPHAAEVTPNALDLILFVAIAIGSLLLHLLPLVLLALLIWSMM